MKKLDRRIVRTRQVLADALITLAQERSYVNLTVRAVTDYAGVAYRTFSRHYLSLDDLLVDIFTTTFRDLKKRALLAKTPTVKCWHFILSSGSIRMCCASTSTCPGSIRRARAS